MKMAGISVLVTFMSASPEIFMLETSNFLICASIYYANAHQ